MSTTDHQVGASVPTPDEPTGPLPVHPAAFVPQPSSSGSKRSNSVLVLIGIVLLLVIGIIARQLLVRSVVSAVVNQPVAQAPVAPAPISYPVADFVGNPWSDTSTVGREENALAVILTSQDDILARAYESRSTDWLKFYYVDGFVLSRDYAALHTSRIPSYTGEAKVAFDRSSFWIESEGCGSPLAVVSANVDLPTTRCDQSAVKTVNWVHLRYDMSIDGATYTTDQELVLASRPNVAKPIWLVYRESPAVSLHSCPKINPNTAQDANALSLQVQARLKCLNSSPK